jgi:hypothetical protein
MFKACYDEGCQIALGKALSAQKTLSAKLRHIGKKCVATATLYDLKTETTERAASIETDCTPESLMGGIRQLATELAGTR